MEEFVRKNKNSAAYNLKNAFCMKRREFLIVAGSTVVIAGITYYLGSDKTNFLREDSKQNPAGKFPLQSDEREILFLASLAPSGHNTQPWFIKYLEPYHWIICNDRTKWLTAVDPTQRETILSIGAFAQTLEYAAANVGYNCAFTLLASTNQDENIMDVKLTKASNVATFDIAKIKSRRTVRSNYLNDVLKNEDAIFLFNEEKDWFHFIQTGSKEYAFLNEQTIEANRIQSYRDAAEKELSDWIRFSSKDAEKNRDGLTAASMEIEGLPAWVVRNFYNKSSVMKNSFRDKNIDNVIKQVSQSAGWLLITSKDNSVSTLLETGKRMQRLFLKVKAKGIAIHPMTQILEEPSTKQTLNQSVGINENIQFILRVGYVKNYPEPVSLRRPVDWFVRS
jgi:nitroreductase